MVTRETNVPVKKTYASTTFEKHSRKASNRVDIVRSLGGPRNTYIPIVRHCRHVFSPSTMIDNRLRAAVCKFALLHASRIH